MTAANGAARSVDPVPSTFAIRRLPAPACEPPYDDELTERPERPGRSQPGDGVQGTLALSFARVAVPATPGKILRLVETPTTAPAGSRGRTGRARTGQGGTSEADDLDLTKRQPVRTSRDQLPDPRPWAHGFVQALTEVLCGFRPLGQLTARAIPTVLTQVVNCRAASSAAPTRQRPVVRSVRVSEPMPGAVEVSATVRHGERCRALALRLEGLDGRWQCTDLILG